jgi:predicted esterase
MPVRFDRATARLALEVCRWINCAAAGAKEAANVAEAQAQIEARGRPLRSPLRIRGIGLHALTSSAAIVPEADRNIVAFSGTLTEFQLPSNWGLGDLLTLFQSLADWVQNGRAAPVPFRLSAEDLGLWRTADLECAVHGGFLDELKAVLRPVIDQLQTLGGAAKPLLLTGHSQGGAVAALATLALAQAGFQIESTYTFAAPRAGTREFVDLVQTPVFRFEYGVDLVPWLPPAALKSTLEKKLSESAGMKWLLLRGTIQKVLDALGDAEYLGLGELYYGTPEDRRLWMALTREQERALEPQRLQRVTQRTDEWGAHHRLGIPRCEALAGYEALASPPPEGWPEALPTATRLPVEAEGRRLPLVELDGESDGRK